MKNNTSVKIVNNNEKPQNGGLTETYRKKMGQELNTYLSDLYAVYLKTQNYHWNVKGPHFYSIHKMLEDHYQELAEHVDVVAERITSLGIRAEGSLKAYEHMTAIEEATPSATAIKMLDHLRSSHDRVSGALRPLIEEAESEHDFATADLLTSMTSHHEKMAWMLRASVETPS